VEGDIALVTGGASGIGEAIVRMLVNGGAQAAIVDLDRRRAATLAADLGGFAVAIEADISRSEEAERAVAETVAAFGRPNILVHAAAPLERSGPALEFSPAAWEKVIAVVLSGGYFAARAFARELTRDGRGRSAHGGRIINIVSSVVNSPRVNAAAYCSAKSGLDALTRVLALELGPHGITVNAVGPGLTITPTVDAGTSAAYKAAFASQVPVGRLGEPNDIAEAVRFLVSPAAAYITGQTLYVDGGYTAGKLSVQG
jgi:NAD(P)-dependent dehydrogenase (short-subunit alcohol dehydrogenase family)